jgi:hypothetical protein
MILILLPFPSSSSWNPEAHFGRTQAPAILPNMREYQKLLQFLSGKENNIKKLRNKLL